METLAVEDALWSPRRCSASLRRNWPMLSTPPPWSPPWLPHSWGFDDTEFYPEFHVKAAILCSRILRNHPLLDGNKRTGYLVMREFVERNGYTWTTGDQDEVADVIEALAAREISEDEFAAWVAERIS